MIGKLGGFGQYAIACDHASIKLPSTLSVEDGALVEPLAVALHGVTLAELKPGAKVLVQGAGPIGLGCVFWSKYRRCRPHCRHLALAAVRSRLRWKWAQRAFVQTSEQLGSGRERGVRWPARCGVRMRRRAWTTRCRQPRLVRPRGTVMLLGNCMVPDTIVPALAMTKQVRIQGSMVYSVGEFETVADVLDAGRVDPRAMVTDTIGYAELPETFEALRHPTTQCKVLLKPHG